MSPDAFNKMDEENRKNDVEKCQNIVSRVVLYDDQKGWGVICSGLTSDFKTNTNTFDIKYEDGSQHRVTLKFDELVVPPLTN